MIVALVTFLVTAVHPHHISGVQVPNAVAGPAAGVLVGNRLADILAFIGYPIPGHVSAQIQHVVGP